MTWDGDLLETPIRMQWVSSVDKQECLSYLLLFRRWECWM